MLKPSGGFIPDFQRQLDEVFEKLIYRRWAIPKPSQWSPRLDLHETRDAYFIEVDLPGVPPEGIEIHVTQDSLTIAGNRPATCLEGSLVSRRERERFIRIQRAPHSKKLDVLIPLRVTLKGSKRDLLR